MEQAIAAIVKEILSIGKEGKNGVHNVRAVDLGSTLDFDAINALVQAAIVKAGTDAPAEANEWDCVIWVRGFIKEGRAIVIDLNPYKTWRW